MSDAIKVNGAIYSWASIELKLNGEVIRGITAVNYSQTRERTKAFGSGSSAGPRGRTAGKYDCEGSITMHADSYEELISHLAELSPDGTSYGDVEFPVVISYVETNLEPVTIELEDCVIVGDTSGESEGTDASVVEVALSVMRILRNGKTLAQGQV
jgi:hypothetical protein